ncbi:MAG: methyltransferase MtaB domain-containing protein [Spirochaetaceae bacterium]
MRFEQLAIANEADLFFGTAPKPVTTSHDVRAMRELCDEAEIRDGIKSTIRLTPNDTRDFDRPVEMRSSAKMDAMMELFEEGAVGPDKDCGYEGPSMKAIAGIPISMEGKTAACAHLSPVGNVPAACCDLWSNESVSNIRLLSCMAPTVYLEQLIYDTRLMNQAVAQGTVAELRSLFVASDVSYDPQAFILAPEAVIPIARAMVEAENAVVGTVRAIGTALDLIDAAVDAGRLEMSERESVWIPQIRNALESIPDNEAAFVEQMLPEIDTEAVTLSEYGL